MAIPGTYGKRAEITVRTFCRVMLSDCQHLRAARYKPAARRISIPASHPRQANICLPISPAYGKHIVLFSKLFRYLCQPAPRQA